MKIMPLIGLIFLSACNGQNQDKPDKVLLPEIGRFQIIQGFYAIPTPRGNMLDEKTVFKIDTVTGEAWFFSPRITKDDSNSWLKINN